MQLIEGYNLIDLFVAGVMLIGFLLGIWKGFVRSLTALASLVLGVLFALKYYPRVEPYLGKISSLDPHISMILSMVIVFIAVQVVFVAIRRLLDALVDLTKLSWLDRILGAIMGLAAGFLIAGAAVEVMLTGIPEWPVIKQSKLVAPVHELSQKALSFAPQSARDHLQALTKKWKGIAETTTPKTRGKAAPKAQPKAAPQAAPKAQPKAAPEAPPRAVPQTTGPKVTPWKTSPPSAPPAPR
jgi:membrane protein required for colicin V production